MSRTDDTSRGGLGRNTYRSVDQLRDGLDEQRHPSQSARKDNGFALLTLVDTCADSGEQRRHHRTKVITDQGLEIGSHQAQRCRATRGDQFDGGRHRKLLARFPARLPELQRLGAGRSLREPGKHESEQGIVDVRAAEVIAGDRLEPPSLAGDDVLILP